MCNPPLILKKELCVKLFLWSNEIKRKKIIETKKNYGTTYLYEWIFLFKKEHLKKKEVSQTKTHEYRLAPYK